MDFTFFYYIISEIIININVLLILKVINDG
jgi:hypothetical protein